MGDSEEITKIEVEVPELTESEKAVQAMIDAYKKQVKEPVEIKPEAEKLKPDATTTPRAHLAPPEQYMQPEPIVPVVPPPPPTYPDAASEPA